MKVSEFEEDLDERVIFTPRLLNVRVSQRTEVVLQYQKGVQNVQFGDERKNAL